MVYDAGGVIGYGWHLNVGGIITREVRGIPDDFYGGWLERAGVFDPNRAYDKSEALVGNRDAEPDIFSFQAGGYVGKFFFEHGTRAVKQIPESDCLILPQWKGAAATIDVDGFVVVTPDGMRYRFGGIVDIGGVNVQLSDLRQPRGTFRDWRNASHIDAGNLKHVYAESYNISSISDIHGNEIKFKYSNQHLYRKNFPTFSAQYQALCSESLFQLTIPPMYRG